MGTPSTPYILSTVPQPPPQFNPGAVCNNSMNMHSHHQTQQDPPYLNSAVAQLGLTTEEIEEVLKDQEEWLREEEQQEQEIDAHTTEQTQHQQWERHGNDNGAQPTPTPFEYDVHVTTNNYDKHII